MSGWKSIGWKRRSGCRYWRGGSSLPRCTLGTYRKWRGGGEEEEGRRGCPPLPITSSDIQANILPLPVTSSPLCLFPSRLGYFLSLFFSLVCASRFVYDPPSPWGIFEGRPPPRRKRMSSLLRAERKFLLAIFAHPSMDDDGNTEVKYRWVYIISGRGDIFIYKVE